MMKKDATREDTDRPSLTVSFVNMPPKEEFVATVKQAVAKHSLLSMEARVERLGSGRYRAKAVADGRAGHCAHLDPQLALSGALAMMLVGELHARFPKQARKPYQTVAASLVGHLSS